MARNKQNVFSHRFVPVQATEIPNQIRFRPHRSKPYTRTEPALAVAQSQQVHQVGLGYLLHFVINARTDTFAGGGNDGSFAEAVRRGNAYLQAGADCIFIPFIHSMDLIKELVKEINGPINILLGASSPTVEELENAGIARVSVGGLFSLVSYSNIRFACDELRQKGTYHWAKNALGHPEMNALMRTRVIVKS